jgi:hypothetical protein
MLQISTWPIVALCSTGAWSAATNRVALVPSFGTDQAIRFHSGVSLRGSDTGSRSLMNECFSDAHPSSLSAALRSSRSILRPQSYAPIPRQPSLRCLLTLSRLRGALRSEALA